VKVVFVDCESGEWVKKGAVYSGGKYLKMSRLGRIAMFFKVMSNFWQYRKMEPGQFGLF
jgi:hypothetical protein